MKHSEDESMNIPMVSVIVPVFRVEQYLNRCVDSLLNQTFTDYEIVLVDDGSDDNCPQICEQYAQRFNNVRVIHQENQGLSGARNTGLDVSRGEFVTFIDSDDWVHPDYLNVLVQNIGDALVCCCKHKTVTEYIEEIATEIKDVVSCTCAQALKRNDCRIYAWAKLYRRTYIADVRFSTDLKNSAEDRVFNAELLAKHTSGKCVIVDNPMYYYFQRTDSLSQIKEFSDCKAIGKMIAIAEDTRCDMLLEYLIDWLYIKKKCGFHIGNPPDYAAIDGYLKKCDSMIDSIITRTSHRIKYKTIIKHPRVYALVIKIRSILGRIKRRILKLKR